MMETANFTYTTSGFKRGQIKRAISNYCWKLDLDVDFEEAKGFFVSSYRVNITGDDPWPVAWHLVKWLKTLG